MPPKVSKNVVQFEQICKEIDNIQTKIAECDKGNQSRITVIKTKIHSLEQRLIDCFAEFGKEESDENLDVYLKYQDNILESLVQLQGVCVETINNTGNIASLESKQSLIKLPKFEIPHFYGDTESWISFKELFDQSILKNKQLSEIEKLQYLHSSVRGNAAKLIRGFSLQSENLTHCWELLCARFENKRHLALCQINKIFSVKIGKANNSKSLLELLDTCNECIRNLKTLGLESNSLSDLMLINFMISKLEEPVKRRWELHLETDQIPDLDTFRVFIEKEARSSNEVKTKYQNDGSGLGGGKRPADVSGTKKSAAFSSVTDKEGGKCIACGQLHLLFRCQKFNAMNVNDRLKFVDSHKLCGNCLRTHKIQFCRINVNCKNCSGRHHTLLHVHKVNTNTNPLENSESISNSVQTQPNLRNSNVLLSTALLYVRDNVGRKIRCKALIDNGSQNSLISREFAERLHLPFFGTKHRLVGINGITAETSLHMTEFEFSPHFSCEWYKIKALIVNRVTSPLPNFQMEMHDWPHIKNLVLADPKFFIKSSIDILIGADLFASLIMGPPIYGTTGAPAAIPTILGHILLGPVNIRCENSTSVVCNSNIIEQEISDCLKEFFTIESVPQLKEKNSSEDKAEKLFRETTRRDLAGRYVVKLPFSEDHSLGESKVHALNRFYSLEDKLLKNPKFKEQYVNFMEEYRTLGHMTPISAEESKITPNYFLPHHGVINENSTTTKLRVVFDASSKTSNGKSLNNVLLKGPKLQSDIFSNLIKFRMHSIAFSSDITKMYRQILINPEDRSYQQIYWRKDPSDPLLVYKLNTVTYGTASAPFLALRTIQQLCKDEEARYPTASKVAKEHFYVDDLLYGSNSVESAKTLIAQLRQLLQSGGFELRKWSSNNPEVLSELPESLKSSALSRSFQSEPSHKILGLIWNCETDFIQVQVVDESRVATKRHLLSVIARTFDPLGLISPSTIILKILLQDIWKAELKWDEVVPSQILTTWYKFNSELNHFKDMQIPRYINLDKATKVELHGFCDSSTKAFAAVVYLRTVHSDTVKVSLLAAKTRVAPLQHVTLPKLELCSAVLLAELVNAIKESMKSSVFEIFLWSDSTITLSWIANPPKKGNQFVQHRVAKIALLTSKTSWLHIPGKLNPADCATRGIYPAQLKSLSMWWQGPEWLQELTLTPSSSVIPESEYSDQEDDVYTFLNQATEFDLLSKFSSYTKLIRVMAWVLRFIQNTLSRSNLTGSLTTGELKNATKIVVKQLQEAEFSNEIKLLKQNKTLPRSNKLTPLNVFLDEEKILRVGGRLSKSPNLTFDKMHPMLLPKTHPVTQAIIRHFHHTSLHSGPELVLSLIRQQFWIPDGRSTVKKELRKCITCLRINARPSSQLMGDLPTSRVTPSKPFDAVGVDYAGPVQTKCQHPRKATVFKSYICLFVCMCTKAVHIEAVSSLSTAAFLAALRRFVSRRGCPSEVFSDNGKNFVGASSYLKEILKISKDPSVQDFCSQKNITWHFIPPYAPNFGGLWESSVKLAKRHLIKVCQGTLTTFEELTTLLCQIESCINSRPLLPLSTDPNDLRALTPGHFLIGAPLLEIPNPKTITNSSLSLSRRWTLLQKMKDDFWTRWSRDYLQSLQPRLKWTSGKQNFQIGDLVFLKGPQLSPLQWTLGKISRLHPGADNLSRVATVKTQKGEILRPVNLLVPLSVSQRPLLPVSTPGPREYVDES